MAERLAVNDVVVVVPGILGSRLSKDGKEVFGISAQAVVQGLLTFGGSLKGLALPDGIGDADPQDGVVATALMNDLQVVPGVWAPIRGYSGLLDWLRSKFELVDEEHTAPGQPVNLVPFPYDWRLSNRLSAERLRDRVESALAAWREQPDHADAKLVFLCHSMGGLVTRYYVDRLGGAGHTRAVLTFGTPHRGALKALVQLVNGQRQGWWKFGIDLTKLVRSLPSVHQLLPTYGCIDIPGRPDLLRLTETDVPELDRARVLDAFAFHEEMAAAATAKRSYAFDAVTGIEQPTVASAKVAGRKVEPLGTMRVTEDGRSRELAVHGDATVPRFSGAFEQPERVEANRVWQVEQHGSLHVNAAILEHVTGVLTDKHVVFRAPRERARPAIGLDLPEVVTVGEPVPVEIVADDEALPLQAVVRPTDGPTGAPIPAQNLGGGRYSVTFAPPAPGGYEVQVSGPFDDVAAPPPVTGALLAWSPELGG